MVSANITYVNLVNHLIIEHAEDSITSPSLQILIDLCFPVSSLLYHYIILQVF